MMVYEHAGLITNVLITNPTHERKIKQNNTYS